MTSVVYYPGPWHIGGAESYVLNIARALGTFGRTAILSGSRPDPEVLTALRLPEGFDPEWRLATTCNQAAVDRLTRDADAFVNCSPWDYPVPPRQALSSVVAFYAPELRHPSLPKRAAREVAARVLRGRPIWPAPHAALARYDRILCVSQWTARLAGERWLRAADVFYPAVRPIPSAPKERLILTVGRIAAGGTRKGHARLIEAFKRLDLAGWRLVIAGAVNYAESMPVIDAWRADLDGAPVEIVVDPTREELERLYGCASIYWHGAGFDATPGSVGREHFGISVVEAMSAGVVPLAYEGGGVREIVTNGRDGVFWTTLDELVDATRRLAGDEETMDRLRRAATDRATYFGLDRHDLRASELLLRR